MLRTVASSLPRSKRTAWKAKASFGTAASADSSSTPLSVSASKPVRGPVIPTNPSSSQPFWLKPAPNTICPRFRRPKAFITASYFCLAAGGTFGSAAAAVSIMLITAGGSAKKVTAAVGLIRATAFV